MGHDKKVFSEFSVHFCEAISNCLSAGTDGYRFIKLHPVANDQSLQSTSHFSRLGRLKITENAS